MQQPFSNILSINADSGSRASIIAQQLSAPSHKAVIFVFDVKPSLSHTVHHKHALIIAA